MWNLPHFTFKPLCHHFLDIIFLKYHQKLRAGAGRSHYVVVTEDVVFLAFGWNKHGQLVSGSAKNDPLRRFTCWIIQTAWIRDDPMIFAASIWFCCLEIDKELFPDNYTWLTIP